ncbi:MAG TPA: MBL fold metallo-hydrolase [Spirochaetia bacterium]|nr:MBL fold metallo-hydrolase [Spirochaetia bacterium]
MEELPLQIDLGRELAQPPRAPGTLALNWLGQAGFALRAGRSLLFVDPYLSNSLGEKYHGKEFPHRRMMQSPIAPEAARGVSAVLCTHGHGDHMDPGTLPVIARENPECRFVVPRAETERAVSRGIAENRLLPLDAGESVPLDGSIRVEAIPAAHEELARNDRGELLHLGYIVSAGGLRVYHSGDCVPYPGLDEALRDAAIDVALMPVNGRSAALTAKRIFGNFFLEETVSLARSAGIPVLFCHHWGMFDFNTIDPREAERKLQSLGAGIRWVLPRVDVTYVMRKT